MYFPGNDRLICSAAAHSFLLQLRPVGEQRELTDDRREKLLSIDPDMTDAEMFELLGWSYEPCYTICFDQDGEMLYADTEMAGRAGFAVQGKEIKTLFVFIFFYTSFSNNKNYNAKMFLKCKIILNSSLLMYTQKSVR